MDAYEFWGKCDEHRLNTRKHLFRARMRVEHTMNCYGKSRWKRIAAKLVGRLREREQDMKLAERALGIGTTTAGCPMSPADAA